MNRSPALPLVFFLIALVLGGWAGWEHRQRRALEGELAALKTERDTLARTASMKVSLRSGTDLDPAGPRGLSDIPGLSPEKDSPEPSKPEAPANPMRDFAKMMEDPTFQDAIKAQTRQQIDAVYRDLFDLLELDPQKREAVEKLLAERARAQMTSGMGLMDPNLTPEEREAKAKEVQASVAEAEKKIQEELGDENFDKLKRFEDSQTERAQIKTFSGMLKDAGIEFPEETESKLMDAMFEERKNFKFDFDFSRPDSADFTKLNEDSLNRFSEQNAQLREKILERAETVLNPEQMEVFRKVQEHQAAMEKMGLQWMRSMTNGGGEREKPAPSPEAN